MKAKSNQLTVESMTQRYSLGHKALSVALSVVLMGFGWPAVSPSQVYAGDGAAADDAAAQVEGASSAAATSTADKAADAAASSAPNSLTVLKDCYVEENLADAKAYDSFQFVRQGFFCVDAKDSTPEHLVFNRIVSLKSSFKLPSNN